MNNEDNHNFYKRIQSRDINIEIIEMLELPETFFKVAIIKMLWREIINTPETSEKKSWLRNWGLYIKKKKIS